MKRLLLTVSIVVSVTAAVPAAFSQNAIDATMRPLDEAAAVDGVIAAIEHNRVAVASSDGHTVQDETEADPQPSEPGLRNRKQRNTDDVVARIDRDQRSDKEVEDFDVPEDIDIPPAPNESQ